MILEIHAGRQSLVDELSSIDQKLADLFLKKVARPLYRGSIHLKPNENRRYVKHDGLCSGNPTRTPPNGLSMMSYPSVMNMEAKVFETMLMEYLYTLQKMAKKLGKYFIG